jgi:hypothetical protein
MANYLRQQSIWCKSHWTDLVWPLVQEGRVVSLSLTMDLNASIFNSPQFREFRRGYRTEEEAVGQFMERYAPLCCLLSKDGLNQLIAANTPEALRQRRPKDAESIIRQDRKARKAKR